MSVTYKEDMGRGGLRLLRVDRDGTARLWRPRYGSRDEVVPWGKYNVRLPRAQLDRLAALLRKHQVWDLSGPSRPALPDEGAISLCVTSGGASLVVEVPTHQVRRRRNAQDLQRGMAQFMAEVVATAATAPATQPGETKDNVSHHGGKGSDKEFVFYVTPKIRSAILKSGHRCDYVTVTVSGDRQSARCRLASLRRLDAQRQWVAAQGDMSLARVGGDVWLGRGSGALAGVRVLIATDTSRLSTVGKRGNPVRPGDAIDVRIQGLFRKGVPTMIRWHVQIAGEIDAPLLTTPFRVAGLEAAELEAGLRAAYGGKQTEVTIVRRRAASRPAAEHPPEPVAAAGRELAKVIPAFESRGTVSLADFASFVQQVTASRLRIQFDSDALRAAGIGSETKFKVQTDGLPLGEVIQAVLDSAAGPGRLGYRVNQKGDVVVSLRKPPAGPQPEENSRKEPEAKPGADEKKPPSPPASGPGASKIPKTRTAGFASVKPSETSQSARYALETPFAGRRPAWPPASRRGAAAGNGSAAPPAPPRAFRTDPGAPLRGR